MARSFAGILGSLAFVTVLIRGLLHGASVDATLGTACLGLAGFTVVGLAAGAIAGATVTAAVKARVEIEVGGRQDRPVARRAT